MSGNLQTRIHNGIICRNSFWLNLSLVLYFECAPVRKPDEAPLPWSTRLCIASGVAQALAYLHHDCTPPIFHYNLTARNVLIDVDLEAKLSDIGLFQFAPASRAKALAAVAKSGYAAPEYLDIWGMPEKVDVYSFGILLLELLTGKKPRDFVQLSEKSDLATWVCVGYLPLIGQSIVCTFASGGRVGDYQLLSFDSMVLSVQSLNPKP